MKWVAGPDVGALKECYVLRSWNGGMIAIIARNLSDEVVGATFRGMNDEIQRFESMEIGKIKLMLTAKE